MFTFIKNRRGKKIQEQNAGYTLLFAVIVSALVLAVGISILTISRKEFLLSGSARDSATSFYAADSGIECAVYADSQYDAFSTTTDKMGSACSATLPIGSKVDYSSSPSAVNPADGSALFKFDMKFGDVGASCAHIEVSKQYVNGSLVTTINSRGYNLGWVTNGASSGCTGLSPKKVERGLQISY